MLPINAELDKTNCLASLVGIRTSVTQQAGIFAPAFFIEDIPGMDLEAMAKLALPSNPTGQALAEFVIASAAREMMGDLELLIKNGYSMPGVLGSQCSTCDLTPVYTTNTGIVVKSAIPSNYQRLQITNLVILANVTGEKNLVFDDGQELKYLPVMVQDGVKMPVKLNYETDKQRVRIYFEDPTVGLGRVSCLTKSSCGCGSAAPSTTISISGIVGGVENATQYGFIPCATIGCNYDALVCSIIGQAQNILGLTLLYKVGEKLTIIKSQSIRQNETASFQDENQGELSQNYSQLYWAKLKGTATMKGVKDLIGQILSTKRGDKCIVCENKFYTAGVTG